MSQLGQKPLSGSLVVIGMWLQAIPPEVLFNMGNMPECTALIQSGQMGAVMPQQLTGVLGELIMLTNGPETFLENLQDFEFINN